MCHFVGNFFLFHHQMNFMIIYLFSQKIYSFTAVLNLIYTPGSKQTTQL